MTNYEKCCLKSLSLIINAFWYFELLKGRPGLATFFNIATSDNATQRPKATMTLQNTINVRSSESIWSSDTIHI